jgi:tetratricopeptide (TPR) repeat protein
MSEEVGWDLISTENYVSLARCYLCQGDLGKALESCDKAIGLSEKEDLKEYTGMARNVLGMIHSQREEWQESAEAFTESINILGEIGSRKRLGDSHLEFGKMWIAKGEGDRAEKHLVKAEEIYADLNLDVKAHEARSALESLRG